MTPIQLKPTETNDKGVAVSELEYVFKDLWVFSKSRLYFDENTIFNVSGSKYVHKLRLFGIINIQDISEPFICDGLKTSLWCFLPTRGTLSAVF